MVESGLVRIKERGEETNITSTLMEGPEITATIAGVMVLAITRSTKMIPVALTVK